MNGTNRERLKIVARSLGDMCGTMVFLGGATVDLYGTSPAAPSPRPTLDVDCIVEVATTMQLHELEEKLRKKGFVNDRSKDAPICRWICQEIAVDLMPTRSEVLGFTNEWYEEGFVMRIESRSAMRWKSRYQRHLTSLPQKWPPCITGGWPTCGSAMILRILSIFYGTAIRLYPRYAQPTIR
jgi:hypothetical protein